MKRKGFTIWELLIAIVIIVIVAAILFPVFAKGHECTRCVSCMSNEKQIGLAVTQYIQDNDNDFPYIAASDGKTTWRVMLAPYTHSKTVFACPSHDGKPVGPDGYPRSYAANYSGNYTGDKSDRGEGVFAGPGARPISMTDIDDAKSLIELCEVTQHSGPDYNIDNLAIFKPNNPFLWSGHRGRGNFLFCDNHVKALKPLDTQTEWHRDSSIPLSPQAVAMLTKAQQRAEE